MATTASPKLTFRSRPVRSFAGLSGHSGPANFKSPSTSGSPYRGRRGSPSSYGAPVVRSASRSSSQPREEELMGPPDIHHIGLSRGQSSAPAVVQNFPFADPTKPLQAQPAVAPKQASADLSPPKTIPSVPFPPSRPLTPPINASFRSSNPVPRWTQPPPLDVNRSTRNYSYGSVSTPYADRGWFEYLLPHGLTYFGNPRKGATTDLDLRNLPKLYQVMSTIDTVDSVPEGCEVWIRPSYKAMGRRRRKTPGQLVIYWVDHRYRRIMNEIPSDDLPVSGEDDRLDDEYRYWSYIEMHPAHVVLTPAWRQEAADALHWSYTDRLLSHPQPVQPPFGQEECQELIRLLDDPGQQSGLSYTRMVARILLRVAHWRHVHFKPHRPLPRDISHHHMNTVEHTPILCTVLEIVVGILCLGIPFLFVDRARYSSHFDVENNTATLSSIPLFVIGACACLAVRRPSVLKVIP